MAVQLSTSSSEASTVEMSFEERYSARWSAVDGLPELFWIIDDSLHQMLDWLRTDPLARHHINATLIEEEMGRLLAVLPVGHEATSPAGVEVVDNVARQEALLAQAQLECVNKMVNTWQSTYVPSQVCKVVLDHCYCSSMPEDLACPVIVHVTPGKRISYWTILCAMDAYYRANTSTVLEWSCDGQVYSIDHVYFEGLISLVDTMDPTTLRIQPRLGS